MIVMLAKLSIDILERYAISQDIMNGLYIERFLDLRVRREGQVEEYRGWDQEREYEICSLSIGLSMLYWPEE